MTIFIHLVGGHKKPSKGSRFHHPKKVTMNCQADVFFCRVGLATQNGKSSIDFYDGTFMNLHELHWQGVLRQDPLM